MLSDGQIMEVLDYYETSPSRFVRHINQLTLVWKGES